MTITELVEALRVIREDMEYENLLVTSAMDDVIGEIQTMYAPDAIIEVADADAIATDAEMLPWQPLEEAA